MRQHRFPEYSAVLRETEKGVFTIVSFTRISIPKGATKTLSTKDKLVKVMTIH